MTNSPSMVLLKANQKEPGNVTRQGQRPVFFFFFFLAYAHMKGYNMFNIGDKVKVISKNNDEYGRVGKVTILKDWSNGQQVVRVAFGTNPFDYTDLLSWGVKKV